MKIFIKDQIPDGMKVSISDVIIDTWDDLHELVDCLAIIQAGGNINFDKLIKEIKKRSDTK
jgi:hypothetical protein